VWAKTVLFISFDENDGFFDHVPPPTPPPGAPGEWLTGHPLPPAAAGIGGPVGLGVRVPLLVVSPFSRGGYVCSDVFDHTSQLRFLETRFGVEVPNLSAWRRATTGDLTSAFDFSKADTTVPPLPPTYPKAPVVERECNALQELELDTPSPPYPIPHPQEMPAQEPGAPRHHG
jgi:phospholipase C